MKDLPDLIVMGAGFTRAFYPDAPLLVDKYDLQSIINKYRENTKAIDIIESEKSHSPQDQINIESLFTRLYHGMPYDSQSEKDSILVPLLSDVKAIFLEKVVKSEKGVSYTDDLSDFARFCINKRLTCITFNYDDFFDKALWEVNKLTDIPPPETPYWHPDGGYGFFCRPSYCCVSDTSVSMDQTSMELLKLHGSINWFVRSGYSMPYTVEELVHHEEWLSDVPYPGRKIDRQIIERHLESEPFIIPPTLEKSIIMEQPILKLVWRQAFKALQKANHVVFIGYSCPNTDIDTNYLFREGLKHLDKLGISIVNLISNESKRSDLISSYKEIFPWISRENFIFVDARNWLTDLIETHT